MNRNKGMITVFYDGACPKCVKDRCHYEKLAGSAGNNINWFDITGQDELLRKLGIDPQKAVCFCKFVRRCHYHKVRPLH